MIHTPGKIFIGTSNGQMPGNKNTFPTEYQKKTRLHYYSRFLNSIEVNSCFYKTPQRTTYEKWVNEVPQDFRFTLKLSKDVTHANELKTDLGCINHFLDAATGIKEKRGCLLIQFPGKISLEYFNQVEGILDHLRILDPDQNWNRALEFRNDTWYVGETTELLDAYNATMVVHDFLKGKLTAIQTKANFIYLRFHGPTGNYRDSYSDKFLQEKAEMIKDLVNSGKDVYTYFNNTAGNAFENARLLQSLLS
jgi:uncharacterized protein YecE (DUF72 family)